jgi:hypothetical protein
MAIGRPGADSSNLVTRLIDGKPMVDVAAELFGRCPSCGVDILPAPQPPGLWNIVHAEKASRFEIAIFECFRLRVKQNMLTVLRHKPAPAPSLTSRT